MGAEAKQRYSLYLRLPVKIKDEHQIRELDPNISIVHLPRQKSRRWCIIDFDSKKQLDKGRQALQVLKINGKRVKVRDFRIPPPKRNYVRLESAN